MADLIAIAMFPAFSPDRNLKREALLFDRIEIYGLDYLLKVASRWDKNGVFDEWHFLREIGLIANPGIQFQLSAEERERARAVIIPESPIDAIRSVTPEDLERLEMVRAEAEAICRSYASWLRSSGHADGVFLGDRSQEFGTEMGKHAVLRVVLKQFPVPSETTPWETVLDFRRDEASMLKYRRLRHWINQVARKEMTSTEIEDELLYLISEFEGAMKLHGMKTKASVIETIVTTSAEVLGNLAALKWGTAARTLFELRKQDIALMEAENSAPGREIAYLIDVKRRFSR